MHQTVNAIMMESRVELFNHNILTLATHSYSPSVPVRILSTSKGHHPCPNHSQLSQPYIPAFSQPGHLMVTFSVSTSWVPYPLASCPHLNPCELCQDPSFNHHSLFHPNISSQADHHPYGPNSFPYTSRSFIQSLSYYCFQSYHLILTYHHPHGPTLFPTSTHLAISSSTANQPSGPSPAQSAPSRLKCL